MEACSNKPCKECPFLKSSAPGWLGGYSIYQYVFPITHDVEHNCHLTHDLEETKYCAGLAATRVNSCKSARSSGVIKDSEEIMKESIYRKECFGFPHEFKKHHTNKFKD